MKNVATLTKRELVAYFLSPMAYIILTVFLVLIGYLFFEFLTFSRRADMTQILGFMGFIWIFIMPLMTMRLFADEFESGTIETLMTAPVTTFEVVVSKYLAALTFLLVLILPTMLYAATLFVYGKPDPGPIVAGYLGLFLLGAFYLAVGMVASACVRTQIAAAVICIVLLLLLYILGYIIRPEAVDPFSKALRYISFSQHFFGAFTKGIVDTRDVLYFLTTSLFCIFLTTVIVTVRRWR
ncbi:MAG TPA: ABC transporter permease [Planctomycetota bacterium]|nr:ABC transporter permease [Planctomycetota bacterium]